MNVECKSKTGDQDIREKLKINKIYLRFRKFLQKIIMNNIIKNPGN